MGYNRIDNASRRSIVERGLRVLRARLARYEIHTPPYANASTAELLAIRDLRSIIERIQLGLSSTSPAFGMITAVDLAIIRDLIDGYSSSSEIANSLEALCRVLAQP